MRWRGDRSVEATIAFLVDHLNAYFWRHNRRGIKIIITRPMRRGKWKSWTGTSVGGGGEGISSSCDRALNSAAAFTLRGQRRWMRVPTSAAQSNRKEAQSTDIWEPHQKASANIQTDRSLPHSASRIHF